MNLSYGVLGEGVLSLCCTNQEHRMNRQGDE